MIYRVCWAAPGIKYVPLSIKCSLSIPFGIVTVKMSYLPVSANVTFVTFCHAHQNPARKLILRMFIKSTFIESKKYLSLNFEKINKNMLMSMNFTLALTQSVWGGSSVTPLAGAMNFGVIELILTRWKLVLFDYRFVLWITPSFLAGKRQLNRDSLYMITNSGLVRTK